MIEKNTTDRIDILAPRGHAKSTWLSIIYPIWKICYNKEIEMNLEIIEDPTMWGIVWKLPFCPTDILPPERAGYYCGATSSPVPRFNRGMTWGGRWLDSPRCAASQRESRKGASSATQMNYPEARRGWIYSASSFYLKGLSNIFNNEIYNTKGSPILLR